MILNGFWRKEKTVFEKTLVSFFPPLTSPLRVHRGRNFSQTILGYCIPRMDKYVAIKNQPLVELSLPPAGIGGAARWQLVPAVHHHLCQLSPVPPRYPAPAGPPATPPRQLPGHALSSLSCPLTRGQIGFDFFSI